jgi:hypothetical protein
LLAKPASSSVAVRCWPATFAHGGAPRIWLPREWLTNEIPRFRRRMENPNARRPPTSSLYRPGPARFSPNGRRMAYGITSRPNCAKPPSLALSPVQPQGQVEPAIGCRRTDLSCHPPSQNRAVHRNPAQPGPLLSMKRPSSAASERLQSARYINVTTTARTEAG